jgi:hypothetical protein
MLVLAIPVMQGQEAGICGVAIPVMVGAGIIRTVAGIVAGGNTAFFRHTLSTKDFKTAYVEGCCRHRQDRLVLKGLSSGNNRSDSVLTT